MVEHREEAHGAQRPVAAREREIGGDLEQQRQVAGIARQRADHAQHPIVHVAPGGQRVRVAAAADEPETGLVAPDAVEMRGVADRGADVAAAFAGHHPTRHRGRAAARGAAGDARVVVRVVGAAVKRVVALEVGEVGRDIGLAQDHRARGLEPLDHHAVARGDVVLELDMAPGGRQSGDVEAFLDRHRYAEQRLVAPRHGHRPRGFARAVEVGDHHGVDVGIELLDLGDGALDRLQWGTLAAPHRRRGGDRAGPVGQLWICHALFPIDSFIKSLPFLRDMDRVLHGPKERSPAVARARLPVPG